MGLRGAMKTALRDLANETIIHVDRSNVKIHLM
jgi:hypothetical protein